MLNRCVYSGCSKISENHNVCSFRWLVKESITPSWAHFKGDFVGLNYLGVTQYLTSARSALKFDQVKAYTQVLHKIL